MEKLCSSCQCCGIAVHQKLYQYYYYCADGMTNKISIEQAPDQPILRRRLPAAKSSPESSTDLFIFQIVHVPAPQVWWGYGVPTQDKSQVVKFQGLLVAKQNNGHMVK